MKKMFILLMLIIQTTAFAGNISSDCSYKSKKLYGNVKVVDSFEDFKVKKVSSFEDLKVRPVTSFADSCGRWHFTESFPDFTIKFVDSFEDFTIKFVDSFEGI